jgi:hypothetical protein
MLYKGIIGMSKVLILLHTNQKLMDSRTIEEGKLEKQEAPRLRSQPCSNHIRDLLYLSSTSPGTWLVKSIWVVIATAVEASHLMKLWLQELDWTLKVQLCMMWIKVQAQTLLILFVVLEAEQQWATPPIVPLSWTSAYKGNSSPD